MDPRTRMFTVLCWLAASMTAGSLLLTWLEPKPQSASTTVSEQQLLERAERAVHSSRLPFRPWRTIEIVPVADVAGDVAGRGDGGIPLTALGPQQAVHFSVLDSGRILPCASWRDQSVLTSADGIRIGIATSATMGKPAAVQSTALTALLDALNAVLSHGKVAGSKPVVLAEWNRGSPFAGALRHLLGRQEGAI